MCDRIGLKPGDIDLLVTNQPNRVFLRNWREALELPRERHVDTFDECGNLFAAGIPVNLDRADLRRSGQDRRHRDDGGFRTRRRLRRRGGDPLGRTDLMASLMRLAVTVNRRRMRATIHWRCHSTRIRSRRCLRCTRP